MRSNGLAVSIAVAVPIALVILLTILAVARDQPHRILSDADLAKAARAPVPGFLDVKLGKARLGKHNGVMVIEHNFLADYDTVNHFIFYDREPGKACDQVGGLTMTKTILGVGITFEKFCVPAPIAVAECEEAQRRCTRDREAGFNCTLPDHVCTVSAILEDQRKLSVDPLYRAFSR